MENIHISSYEEYFLLFDNYLHAKIKYDSLNEVLKQLLSTPCSRGANISIKYEEYAPKIDLVFNQLLNKKRINRGCIRKYGTKQKPRQFLRVSYK